MINAPDLSKTGNIGAAQERYSEIKARAAAYSDNADILLEQAKAAYNLALAYGRAGNTEAAQELYNDIKALAAHSDFSRIRPK